MRHVQQLTAIIEREGNGYVSLCQKLMSQAKGTPSSLPERICKKPSSCS